MNTATDIVADSTAMWTGAAFAVFIAFAVICSAVACTRRRTTTRIVAALMGVGSLCAAVMSGVYGQHAYDARVNADVDAVAQSISATYGGQVNPEVLHQKVVDTVDRTRTGIGPMPVWLPAGVQQCIAVYRSVDAAPTLLCGTDAVEPPHVRA